MIFNWKPFKINLKYFFRFLNNQIPNSDGIAASSSNLHVVEAAPLTQSEQTQVTNYYDNLTEEGENYKFYRDEVIGSKIQLFKEDMLEKNWDDLTLLERKVILSLELSDEEKDNIILLYE